ncbi:MAG: hypothetical protein ACREHG_03600, partial [Candidatus Saccharimonadales bacterium]
MSFSIQDHIEFTGTGDGTSVHANGGANGDSIFLFIAVNQSATGRVKSVTDSKGNTYFLVKSTAVTNIDGEVWACMNANTDNSNQFTVKFFTQTDIWAADAITVRGVGYSNSQDLFVHASGTSTTPASGSGTSASANEIIFGFNAQASNRAWGTGTGYTGIGTVGNGSTIGLQTQYKTVTSTGSQSEAATLDLSVPWLAIMISWADTSIGTNPNVTDTTAVSESVSLIITPLQINVTDSSAVSDQPFFGTFLINVTDTVAVTDTPVFPQTTNQISRVQVAGANSVGYVNLLAVSLPNAVQAGDYIALAISHSWNTAVGGDPNSGDDISTVTDSLGNTYT